MYLGEHYHKVDVKGRVSMPSEFRDIGGTKFYVMYGVDRCLHVYDEAGFRKQAELIVKLDDSKEDVRALKRVFFRVAPQVCDGPGRILLSQKHLEHARIEREVVMVGMNDRIEIWSKGEWERQQQEDLAHYHENVEKMPTMVRKWALPDSLPAVAPHASGQESNNGA